MKRGNVRRTLLVPRQGSDLGIDENENLVHIDFVNLDQTSGESNARSFTMSIFKTQYNLEKRSQTTGILISGAQ